jgi:hypothetical protein
MSSAVIGQAKRCRLSPSGDDHRLGPKLRASQRRADLSRRISQQPQRQTVSRQLVWARHGAPPLAAALEQAMAFALVGREVLQAVTALQPSTRHPSCSQRSHGAPMSTLEVLANGIAAAYVRDTPGPYELLPTVSPGDIIFHPGDARYRRLGPADERRYHRLGRAHAPVRRSGVPGACRSSPTGCSCSGSRGTVRWT